MQAALGLTPPSRRPISLALRPLVRAVGSSAVDLFPTMTEKAYESVHFFHDSRTGLRAIVALHDTTFGPGLGGTRAISTYETEAEAVDDALRLARGMTFKATLANIPFGGGKAVIMLPKEPFDRPALFEAFGRAVDTLGGRYITTEDAGTSPEDVAHMRRGTKHVVGMPREMGGSGDPSPFTAFGVVRGIEALAKFHFGRSDLEGLKVSILGVGHVGYALARLLHERGVKLWVADVNPEATRRAAEELGAVVVSPEELLSLEVDVFSPCALGGAINDRSLPLLRCKAVAGSANNQLREDRHGKELYDRGIVYVPDYVINAGGLINVAQEVEGYDEQKSREKVSRIYDTVYAILERAKAENSRPEVVADRIVLERLAKAKAEKAA